MHSEITVKEEQYIISVSSKGIGFGYSKVTILFTLSILRGITYSGFFCRTNGFCLGGLNVADGWGKNHTTDHFLCIDKMMRTACSLEFSIKRREVFMPPQITPAR